MSKTAKRILIAVISIVAVAAIAVGAVFGIRAANRKPVNVYNASDFAMTNYWGDTSETYGMVTTDKIQKIYPSQTQTITEVFVNEGDEVKAGDLLLAYDTTLSDIDLEKAEINLQRLELNLENAQKELAVIRNLQPHYSRLIVPDAPEIKYNTQETPKVISGSGTMDDPLYVLFGEDDEITDAMIAGFFETAQKEQAANAEKEKPTDAAQEKPADAAQAETLAPDKVKSALDTTEGGETPEASTPAGSGEDEQTQPVTESATEAESESQVETAAPEPATQQTEPETGAPEPTQPETEEVQPVPVETDVVYAAFITRANDALNGMITRSWGLRFQKSDSGYRMRYYDPMLSEDIMNYEESPMPYYEEYGSDYTSAEIAQMRSQKEQEIVDLQSQLNLAGVELERLKTEINDGRVYANIDGVVKAVRDPDAAKENNEAVLEVSAGGGYYIRVAMSELELDTMQIGQNVSVNSWETGAMCDGSVVEILDYPTTDSNSWSNGNTNVSYYPFVVFVNEDANLREGSYVNVTYENANSSPGSIYLEQMFIRSENGKNYIYVEGTDGKLEKRPVQTGKSLWGSYLEIRSGLSVEDHIAFPYGKDVVPGAAVIEAATEDFYKMANY